MATAYFTHSGNGDYPADKRESHWQPALRPDAHELVVITHPKTILPTPVHFETTTHSVGADASEPDPVGNDTEPQQTTFVERGDAQPELADPFEGVQRSTSFPAPQVLSPTVESVEPDLWNSQNSLQEATDFASLLQEPDGNLDLLPGAEGNIQEPVLYSEIPQDTTSEGFQERSSADRFEEGLPLLAAEKDVDRDLDNQGISDVDASGFDVPTVDEPDSFFSQLGTQADAELPAPSLDRKSTADVIGALHVTDRKLHDSIMDPFLEVSQPLETGGSDLQFGAEATDGDDGWAAALGDEDDFLIEDADDLLPDSEPGSPSSFLATLQQDQDIIPHADLQSQIMQHPSSTTQRNAYMPQQPSSTISAATLPVAQHGSVGFPPPGLGPMQSFQAHLQQPAVIQRAESFADQSKGGYKSPYDLPLDISKNKRRPQASRAASQPQKGLPLPPPRSSSVMVENPSQPAFDSASGNSTVRSFSTAISSSASQGLGAAPQRVASSASFFEELPTSTRPRPSQMPARSTPIQPSLPEAGSLQPPPSSSPRQRIISAPVQSSVPNASDPYSQFQLQPPEKLDPYASVALPAQSLPTTAPATRYSPAPGSANGVPKPAPSPRYSPAPAALPPSSGGRYVSQPVTAQAPVVSPGVSSANRYVAQPISALPPSAAPSLAHQPRTSSPLAYQHRPASEQASLMPPPPLPRSSSATSSRPASPPKRDSPTRVTTPHQGRNFSPQRQTGTFGPPEATPPQRSHTQSPSQQSSRKPPFPHTSQSSLDRPASAYGIMSPVKSGITSAQYQPTASQHQPPVPEIDFLQPQDETAADPLRRWKGAPIFRFGFGGQIATSFPARTPRFSSGMVKPQMKTGPGPVKVQKSSEVSPISIAVASFPGPLRGKSKKKEVLTWMTASIARLEAESPAILGLAQTLPDPRKRHEEKVLLFRLIKILVEFDGQLEGNVEALKAINIILTPEVHAIDESTASRYPTDNETAGIYRPRGASARLEPINPLAVESLRKDLLKGKREEAVWHAVDARLWSHALLIASTLDQKIWKQVVQEFVRQEVKTIGNNAEALAALYEIFGGNAVDSIDQLVPPSARAGLQMVSRVDSAGPIKNALDGLDKWKETLALVLNNRSKEDYSALLTLARLLGEYGRIEAAHCCLLFARNPSFPMILGGLDDSQASAILLGANHRTHPGEIHNDEDCLLLTEVYEFATCTLAGSSAAIPLPHLAPYKLYKAKGLADSGFKTEAQAYCEAVAAGLKATTRASPYYHPTLLAELDELSNRLKQTPVPGGSWMSKPSIEKVSGSIFSKFTNFVAGEDSDAASQASAKDGNGTDIGPFANVSGSPNLSRSGSQTDLYGAYSTSTTTTVPIPMTGAGSRYAPNGILSARSSSEFGRGRPSFDSQRSPPATSYGEHKSIYSPLGQASQTQSPVRSISAYQPTGTSPGQQFGTSPLFNSFNADSAASSYVPVLTQQQPEMVPVGQQVASYEPVIAEQPPSYVPSIPAELDAKSSQTSFGGYLPTQYGATADQFGQEQSVSVAEQPQSYGYEPPSDSAYVPYQPEPDSDNEGKKSVPKKKSFMDDDSYGVGHNSQSTLQNTNSVPAANDNARRKANDEAAEAAFKAAAEADAQRAKEAAAAKRTSGWFGGWLGGGKKGEESLDTKAPAGDQKVYKANLGENKMKLYYDKDLKKWINPDDPDAGKSKGATPPPPRLGGGTPLPPMGGGTGPPPRIGGSAPPPTSSRSSTPASIQIAGLPPTPSDGIASTLPPSVNTSLGFTNGSTPSPSGLSATPISAGSRPASSPATTGIDDLLGPPTGARKGARGAKKAKGGRYIDVMAK